MALCQNWEQFGANIIDPSSNLYTANATNVLLANGTFIDASDDTIIGLAKWYGTNWDSLGHQQFTEFYKVIAYNGSYYALGAIGDPNTFFGIYKYDCSNWNMMVNDLICGSGRPTVLTNINLSRNFILIL